MDTTHDYTVTATGFAGELATNRVESAYELALTLSCEGYSVKLNDTSVCVYHGPGYDYLVEVGTYVDMREKLGLSYEG